MAAGIGLRFGGAEDLKPLARLGAYGLVERNLRMLSRLGIGHVSVVTGHASDAVAAHLDNALSDTGIQLTYVFNPEYMKSNGISAMVGIESAGQTALLLMADHAFDETLLVNVLDSSPPSNGAILYVDRKIETVFDLDDATKVKTAGFNEKGDAQVLHIGKQLDDFDAVDTGLFIVTSDLSEVLTHLYMRDGDCSLSDGIGRLAQEGKMWVRDIGPARWQDIDTTDALLHAINLFEV